MRRSPCIAAAPGAAIVVVDTALAFALGNSSVFVPLLVIGPLVAAALASPRCTLGVAVLAVACAVPLGLADDSVFSAEHIGEMTVVAAGGALAVLAAAGRRRYEEALVTERAARRRSDFVARAGELLEAPPEPEAMLREIVRMAVPYMAELCIVDLVHDGELGETTAYATDPRTLDMLHASRTRYPLDAGGPHPVAVAARTGRPHLQHEIGTERLRAFAVDEDHLKLMQGAGYATSLAVPLIARGRTIGVLSFMRFGGAPRYDDTDAELASEVARRAALALDNARLFAELSRTEGQLEAVLANLAAAVTVQAPDGTLVYVNQAAAEMMGCSSPDEVLAMPLAELLDAFVILDEDGRPYDLARPPRPARARRRGAAPGAHAHDRQGHRRGALGGDQGDAGARRARRRRARGQHHRGRHRRAPGRAPAALPLGGEHARLLLAGHRRHARQGRGRGGARAGRLVLRRRARRARRRAARGDGLGRGRPRWAGPDARRDVDGRRRPRLARARAAHRAPGADRRLRRGRGARMGRWRRGAGGGAARQSGRARRWSSRSPPATASSAS